MICSFHAKAEENGSGMNITTVAMAKQSDNKAQVALTGVIVQRDGNYYLRDITGQIKLDFPPAKKITVITNARVRITGKIKTNLLRLLTKSVDPTVRVRTLEVVPIDSEDSSDTDKKP